MTNATETNRSLPFSGGFKIVAPQIAEERSGYNYDPEKNITEIMLCDNTGWWIEKRPGGTFYTEAYSAEKEGTLMQVISFAQSQFIFENESQSE